MYGQVQKLPREFLKEAAPAWKKYELVREQNIKNEYGVVLFRIRALRDVGSLKAGELGGYVESERNLSHEGSCFVYDDAQVFENALVCDDARVSGKASVLGQAIIRHNASVCGNAWVCDRGLIECDAQVYDNATVFDSGVVTGNSEVFDCAAVCGSARVSGYTKLGGHTRMRGDEDKAKVTNLDFSSP